mmetsp:Transcript_19615/g.48901  ORF Transcript_19615/g.48901 Transcript_19615/m.48901 type:complete len:224 (+) Transcript_19615:26-697(+)
MKRANINLLRLRIFDRSPIILRDHSHRSLPVVVSSLGRDADELTIRRIEVSDVGYLRVFQELQKLIGRACTAIADAGVALDVLGELLDVLHLLWTEFLMTPDTKELRHLPCGRLCLRQVTRELHFCFRKQRRGSLYVFCQELIMPAMLTAAYRGHDCPSILQVAIGIIHGCLNENNTKRAGTVLLPRLRRASLVAFFDRRLDLDIAVLLRPPSRGPPPRAHEN